MRAKRRILKVWEGVSVALMSLLGSFLSQASPVFNPEMYEVGRVIVHSLGKKAPPGWNIIERTYYSQKISEEGIDYNTFTESEVEAYLSLLQTKFLPVPLTYSAADEKEDSIREIKRQLAGSAPLNVAYYQFSNFQKMFSLEGKARYVEADETISLTFGVIIGVRKKEPSFQKDRNSIFFSPGKRYKNFQKPTPPIQKKSFALKTRKILSSAYDL